VSTSLENALDFYAGKRLPSHASVGELPRRPGIEDFVVWVLFSHFAGCYGSSFSAAIWTAAERSFPEATMDRDRRVTIRAIVGMLGRLQEMVAEVSMEEDAHYERRTSLQKEHPDGRASKAAIDRLGEALECIDSAVEALRQAAEGDEKLPTDKAKIEQRL
jgi:hypothetical protein